MMWERPTQILCSGLWWGVSMSGSSLRVQRFAYVLPLLNSWALKVVPTSAWGQREQTNWGAWKRRSVQLLSSVQLRPYRLQHARLPCPSPSPGACSNSCPSSWWCHPIISSSAIPFCLQSFPASGSFPMNQLFPSGDQSIGASSSASVLPIQDWFPLGWTGWISLQSEGLKESLQHHSSKASILWRSAFFIESNSHIHTWLLEKP